VATILVKGNLKSVLMVFDDVVGEMLFIFRFWRKPKPNSAKSASERLDMVRSFFWSLILLLLRVPTNVGGRGDVEKHSNCWLLLNIVVMEEDNPTLLLDIIAAERLEKREAFEFRIPTRNRCDEIIIE